MSPCILVLAAGSGTRFAGSGHKLDARIGADRVLALTLRHAMATGLRVVLVISARLVDEMGAALPAGERAVVDTAAQADWGMGDSIALGVSAAHDADGWLVLPGDMPFVRPDTLARVAAALADHPVAFARHAGQRGHPVAFRAELRDQLLALRGDEGARSVVARSASAAIDVDDAGVLLDIDTQDDLAVARQRAASVKVVRG